MFMTAEDLIKANKIRSQKMPPSVEVGLGIYSAGFQLRLSNFHFH